MILDADRAFQNDEIVAVLESSSVVSERVYNTFYYAWTRRAIRVAACAALVFPGRVSAEATSSHVQALAFYDAAYDRWQALPRPPFATYDAVVTITRSGRVKIRHENVAMRLRDHICRIAGVPLDARDRPDPPNVTHRCLWPDSALTLLPRAQEGAGSLPLELPTTSPEASDAPRTIARVTVRARAYDITYAGDETVNGIATVHVALRPYQDPTKQLVRDLWIDRATNGVVRLHCLASAAARLASVDIVADYDEDAKRQVLRHVAGFAKVQLLFAKVGADFTFDLTNLAFPTTLPDAIFDKRSGD